MPASIAASKRRLANEAEPERNERSTSRGTPVLLRTLRGNSMQVWVPAPHAVSAPSKGLRLVAAVSSSPEAATFAVITLCTRDP